MNAFYSWLVLLGFFSNSSVYPTSSCLLHECYKTHSVSSMCHYAQNEKKSSINYDLRPSKFFLEHITRKMAIFWLLENNTKVPRKFQQWPCNESAALSMVWVCFTQDNVCAGILAPVCHSGYCYVVYFAILKMNFICNSYSNLPNKSFTKLPWIVFSMVLFVPVVTLKTSACTHKWNGFYFWSFNYNMPNNYYFYSEPKIKCFPQGHTSEFIHWLTSHISYSPLLLPCYHHPIVT